MSLLGTLEQLNLSGVLQRIETHNKTGLLVVKQDVQWVEFYFRDGRLMCIGPIRTSATLGDRLLQDGVISRQELQEALLVVGNAQHSETRMALTLMDLTYVGHEELRTWATRQATEVLQVVLSWTNGEIYFEEQAAPAADRLLVALLITSLFSAIPPTTPLPQADYSNAQSNELRQPAPKMPQAPQVPQVPKMQLQPAPSTQTLPETAGLINGADLFADDASFAAAFPSTEPLSPGSSMPELDNMFSLATSGPEVSIGQPVAVMRPVPPKRIDTSFMRPDMVLMPVDLSAARAQNPQIQMTPEQWRLLTKVDGHTSLQVACQQLAMTPEMVCMVAGELIAEGLIQLSLPTQMSELSPISREQVSSGLSNGFIAPGYSAVAAQPWSAGTSSTGAMASFGSGLPFETQSQWGNGGNGATFIPGKGWIASPQPLQPFTASGPLASSYSDMYAQVGGAR